MIEKQVPHNEAPIQLGHKVEVAGIAIDTSSICDYFKNNPDPQYLQVKAKIFELKDQMLGFDKVKDGVERAVSRINDAEKKKWYKALCMDFACEQLLDRMISQGVINVQYEDDSISEFIQGEETKLKELFDYYEQLTKE